MLLVLAVILLVVSIDCALGNKISDIITGYIENICNKLHNKKQTDLNQISDTNKECYGKATLEYRKLVYKRLNHDLLFNVPIPFNTPINVLEMIGLDNYRWIVNNDFELIVRNQRIDISNFCTVGNVRTVVFFIGENNKFTFNINRDTGETIIKTNSKEFDSEVAILTFGAKCIQTPKNYYGKAGLELSRKAKKILEEKEN